MGKLYFKGARHQETTPQGKKKKDTVEIRLCQNLSFA